MGDVINMEDFRAEYERRKKAKIERRKRQQKRVSRNRGENSPETSLPSGEDYCEDDPA